MCIGHDGLSVIEERYSSKMFEERYIKIWLYIHKQHFRSWIWLLMLQPIEFSKFWICLYTDCSPSIYVFRLKFSAKMRPQEANIMYFKYIYYSINFYIFSMSFEILQKHDFITILMPMKDTFPFMKTTYLILYNTDLIWNLWCLGFWSNSEWWLTVSERQPTGSS